MRGTLFALAIAIGLAARTATAAPCGTETAVVAEACVAGSVADGATVEIHWQPAAGLWRVEVEALPGQAGMLRIEQRAADGSRTAVWQGTLSAGSLVAPPLFLAGAEQVLTVAAADGPLVYRLRLESVPLPADAMVLQGAGDTIDVPWRPTGGSGLWTVALQPEPGASPTLTLLDAAGAMVASSNRGDAAGVVRLPDLDLRPGAYGLSVRGLTDGQSAVLTREAQARPPTFAAEPDDDPATAHPLALGSAATGRLATGGVWGDQDVFRLTIPPGAPRRVDARLTGPASLTLALIDETGTVLQQRVGEGEVRLSALSLAPGTHRLRVSGVLDVAAVYRLIAEDGGAPRPGEEAEPNDVAAGATPLSPDGRLAGAFTGDDVDHVDLGVAGALQLWTVTATGDGIARLALQDGVGAMVAAASPVGGDPVVRLSRLLLPPGHNILRLDGSDGRWLLRAEALGPPVAGEEIEANDDPAHALDLAFDRPQIGWLDRPEDRDVYAFHLAAAQHVHIELTGPADFPIQATLDWGDAGTEILRGVTAGTDGTPWRLAWDTLLPPGDHLIVLSPYRGRSLDPYRLSLAAAPTLDAPADLEPNDEPWQARALPPTGRLDGVMHADGPDWFRIGAGRSLSLTAAALPPRGLGLTLARAGDGIRPEVLAQARLDAVGDRASFDLPGGGDLLLGVDGDDGAYTLTFGPATAAPPVAATLTFEVGTVAAYAPSAQRLAGTLTLHSDATLPLTLDLAGWIGDERWAFDGLPGTVALPPQGVVALPVTLEIAADARDDAPVAIEIALSDHGPPVLARTAIAPVLDAPMIGAHPDVPLPPALLGRFDVAWSALGATTDADHADLIDCVADAEGTAIRFDAPVDIDLAGEEAIDLVGVVLRPPAAGSPADRLARFAVEVSADGEAFARVLEARLSPMPREQPFIFDAPVAARVVRVVALSRHGGPRDDRARLAGFAALADTAPGGLDIASRTLGGHVVRAVGLGEQAITGEGAIWPGDRSVLFPAEREAAPEWVLGFRDGRAAHIAAMRWHERDDTVPETRMRVVEVAVSTAGPLGPWTSLGRWSVDAPLSLAAPVWARALSFRVVEPASGAVALPDRVEVVEADGPSVLGAWGEGRRTGPYEAAMPARTEPATGQAVERTLALGELAAGRVRRGMREDAYTLDLPGGTLWLRARFEAPPEVALTLVDGTGGEIAMTPLPGRPGELAAAAGPGPWRLTVAQPPQSVMAAWDTSGSVAGFVPDITRAIQGLAWGLDPRREAINLLPFRGEGSVPLLDRWTGDPAAIYGALHAYGWSDDSSDAESALLAALSALDGRTGGRAVVLITDASYANVYRNEALWRAIERTGARIFTLQIPSGAGPAETRAQTALMQDWAGATGGFTAPFASASDGAAAFRRVAAWLARPAPYAFTLTAETTPLPPGRLSVVADPAAGAGRPGGTPPALEIVLDASGSMLAQIDGRPRIDLARDALTALDLPQGMPVGLRVFGHMAGASCRSDLVLPPAPLDRAAFATAVAGVAPRPLAKTALAEAIRAAGDDLPPDRSVLLVVTDGEETCGGDPLAEIERLRARGLDVRLQIVGFAVDDPALRRTFESWAAAGGGAYFEGADAAGLATAVRDAAAAPFTVVDETGEERARGAVGGPPVALPPGRYRVRVGEADYAVEIGSATDVTVAVAPP